MLFDRVRPHAVRERRTAPDRINTDVARAVAAAERRAARAPGAGGRAPGCEAWAVHRATDGTRVVTVEAWHSAATYHADASEHAASAGPADDHAGLYAWAGTGGREPTPVADASAGVIIIDRFPVWRPLVAPVARFNVRNGEAFNRQPGCVSTTVLRGLTVGGIATYARWRSEADFLAAFSAVAGAGTVHDLDALNRAAARKTRGLVRPDYHAYVLVAAGGDAVRGNAMVSSTDHRGRALAGGRA